MTRARWTTVKHHEVTHYAPGTIPNITNTFDNPAREVPLSKMLYSNVPDQQKSGLRFEPRTVKWQSFCSLPSAKLPHFQAVFLSSSLERVQLSHVALLVRMTFQLHCLSPDGE